MEKKENSQANIQLLIYSFAQVIHSFKQMFMAAKLFKLKKNSNNTSAIYQARCL